MPRTSRSAYRALALTLIASIALAAPAAAQLGNILNGQPLGGPTTLDGLGDTGGQATPESIVTVSAEFAAPTAGKPAMLAVTALIAPPWHTYSLHQKKGALPTVITVGKSNDYRLIGEFRPNLPPKIVKEFGETLEQHEGEVTWQAPIEIRPGVDLKTLKIAGKVRIQVCDKSCLAPTDFEFTAELTGPAQAAAPAPPTGVFQYPNSHTTLRGHLDAKTAAPGSTVNLVITAEASEGFNNYELAPNDATPRGYKPTLLLLTNVSGFGIRPTKSSQQVMEVPGPVAGEPNQRIYKSPVTWTTPLVIPKDFKPGPYVISGLIAYQACNELNCDMPRGAKFEATVMVAGKSVPGEVPLAFREASYAAVAKEAKERPSMATSAEAGAVYEVAGLSSLPLVILSSLFGGFLLNFMPCVLPVIGLKILSFAEQAGRSRGHILTLNLWYSAGLLSVFMVLATLASAANLGLRDANLSWGEQFSSTSFNVTMVAIVFVMALSFLGVWEIPIPGFVGSSKANDVALRDGAIGAFAKGVLTTVLATPCSGPLLGAVFGYTLNQPPSITYLIFACIGLGMAAPYLVIGAFPSLVRFIPKPGAWMDTFKHLMGFAMLGTIVFFFSFMDRDYLVPTFAMMVGLWAACWWIGRVSLVETFSRKSKAWLQGAVFAALVGFSAFHWLTPHESIIPWKAFSQAELANLTKDGYTVMVDFTAEWCPNCKFNLATAIETEEVRQLLEENHVVPLLADNTKFPPDVQQAIESLHSRSIPLLAIFPAGKPNAPIVLRDVIAKQKLLDALREAGPSKPVEKADKELTASAR